MNHPHAFVPCTVRDKLTAALSGHQNATSSALDVYITVLLHVSIHRG